MVICIGSFATGTSLPDSDIDVTVIVPPDKIIEAGSEKEFLTKILFFLSVINSSKAALGEGDQLPDILRIGKKKYSQCWFVAAKYCRCCRGQILL